jgi:hypothetical protein
VGGLILSDLLSKERNSLECGIVPTDPSTNPVEQPNDLFLNGLAHTAFIHVGITARPVALLASSLFSRAQEDNYARKNHTYVASPA